MLLFLHMGAFLLRFSHYGGPFSAYGGLFWARLPPYENFCGRTCVRLSFFLEVRKGITLKTSLPILIMQLPLQPLNLHFKIHPLLTDNSICCHYEYLASCITDKQWNGVI